MRVRTGTNAFPSLVWSTGEGCARRIGDGHQASPTSDGLVPPTWRQEKDASDYPSRLTGAVDPGADALCGAVTPGGHSHRGIAGDADAGADPRLREFLEELVQHVAVERVGRITGPRHGARHRGQPSRAGPAAPRGG